MKSALITGPGQMEIRETEKPSPKSDEILIRLSQVSICGSDLSVFQGHRPIDYPHIAGHEAVGFVEAVGTLVQNHKIGDRVVVEPNIPCGQCRPCRKGKAIHCDQKRVIGLNQPGCFAEYACAPAEFCWKIPENISETNAALIEPVSVAYHALAVAKTNPEQKIAILGLGGIGLLLCYLARKMGYEVWVNDLMDFKKELARQMGAHIIEAPGSKEEQITALQKAWNEADIDTIFECAGSAVTPTIAIAAAPKGSQVVLLGLSDKLSEFQALHVVRNGIQITPSLIYDHPDDFQAVIRLIETGAIDPAYLASKIITLEELPEVMKNFNEEKHCKIAVKI
ncbi:zinc-binding dehydrogenase [Jiulongibacter sediminis]|jgi:threonine dehydrogenase-like Zn-dependent dehydrogenase|uniref:zinc-dependent alcohol dehydrogenase n=1 Tax=Jiulongibacter sediminis TaxID=1605367 RepID=UPI0026EBFD87|nr:alcohol dehydrogenase catalytic domain-containing protein [Jiulongibacter sediminis]